MVKMLLDAGADPVAADEHGKTVLDMAREARHPDVEALVLEAERNRRSQREAAGKDEV